MFIDSSLGLYLDSPLVPKLSYTVFFKRDMSVVENNIGLGFKKHDNGVVKMVST